MRGRLAATMGLLALTVSARAADLATLPIKAPPQAAAYDWTGWYAGGHLGYAWGTSDFSSPTGIAGALDLFQPFDAFKGTGSYFGGLQAGYNYMLPDGLVVGAEADTSFPSLQNSSGISIGGQAIVSSPAGPEGYAETALSFGTIRGRVGYAPGNWLFYATGGFAWSYDQLTLTQLTGGVTDSPLLWRLGWAAGGGVEVPVMPHWTASLEYLFIDYGTSGVLFANAGQRFASGWSQQELRAGLNYHFDDDKSGSAEGPAATADPDIVNFHAQTTLLWQGYPAFRSPYQGPNSLPGGGEGRETWDATLYAGVRLWQGAEFWINPEIDQGFGIGDTLGIAGFTSGEAYKVGDAYPYTEVPRAFIRQTISLGGDTQKVDAGINQFAEAQTANRLVITVGKFAVTDVFDNNKYAHDPRNDFMNWALIDTATFDYAANAWGYTYGAAAEWYQGNWTLRGGFFDLSAVPNSIDLDPSFGQYQWVGEIERRYDLSGHPGKLAVTGFLSSGRMGSFADAIALAAVTGGPADIAAVRQYQSRGGISLNLEQEITSELGVFARAGVANGNIEPYEFTDVDRTAAAGLSLNGKTWGRPDDTVGIAGAVNGITKIHEEYLNDGGLGILVGDGMLPHPGAEQIIETYYSYALSASTHLTADYQFIANPSYNEDRGPVNVFSGRFHWQF
jgi:high affinity Mn2+ porin